MGNGQSQVLGLWAHQYRSCTMSELVCSAYCSISHLRDTFGISDDLPPDVCSSCFFRPGHCELMSYRYDEAINLLYTSNTISIRHLHIISQFRTVLPPQRLNLVTSLHLSWTIDWRAAWVVYPPVHGSTSSSRAEDQPTWLNAWKILARFKGLKVLRIELRDCYRSYYPTGVENRAMLLNDMCCIKQVRVFEVWVPWRLEDLGFVIEESPFTLLGQDGVVWEQTRK